MLTSKGIGLCVSTVLACLFAFSSAIYVSNQEWQTYKAKYGKSYIPQEDIRRRLIYSSNKNHINIHNARYDRNQITFSLGMNQYTDMSDIEFNQQFPLVSEATQNTAAPLPIVVPNLSENFNPITDLGFQFNVEDQGTVGNSGWAYATAKTVEIMNAYQTGISNPASLSAQQLMDCAGRCKNQVPQAGFDFLTVYRQALYTSNVYPNVKTETLPGICLQRPTPPMTTLTNYARINDNDDATLRRMVSSYPVVIGFNPTSFEFRHYSGGIFQQPITSRGSHFMTVIGYGRDTARNLNYFILQNSFNTTWGENGLIRIAYSASKPLTKSAILPIG